MLDMETTMRRGMVLAMVQRQIMCRFTGDVLDVDTCAVVLDADGDPMDVASPRVLDMLTDADMAAIEAEGCSIKAAPFGG